MNQIEQEMLELNEQFSEFLKTKGIIAKFKLAFKNMAESTNKQHQEDVARLNEIKEKSKEGNKEFVEFIHTKGIKAKFRLVVENIKKGASTQSTKTAEQIAKVKVQTQASIKRANTYSRQNINTSLVTAEMLAEEFNNFLKSKGLDAKYSVIITEE